MVLQTKIYPTSKNSIKSPLIHRSRPYRVEVCNAHAHGDRVRTGKMCRPAQEVVYTSARVCV